LILRRREELKLDKLHEFIIKCQHGQIPDDSQDEEGQHPANHPNMAAPQQDPIGLDQQQAAPEQDYYSKLPE